MATYYVGIGGNDGNSGLTWALRKLTLNGAEDIPVAVGDIVIVGPGVYREMLICDVSGGNAYNANTVTVTNGSTTVTGAGTAFLANVAVADMFHVSIYASGNDGVTNGTATFTSAAGNFQAAMVGQIIQINTRGAYGIGAVAAANSITLVDLHGFGWPGAIGGLSYSVMSGEGPYEIDSITDNTNLELLRPWHAPTLTGLAYLTYRPIRYIANPTGELTDGIGGIVRITGSDNDQTPARDACIDVRNKNYRLFRGFFADTANRQGIFGGWTSTSYCTIEDCVICHHGEDGIRTAGNSRNNTVRRCVILDCNTRGVYMSDGVTRDDTGNLFENSLFGLSHNIISTSRLGGIVVRNCRVWGSSRMGVEVLNLAFGQTVIVENCEVVRNDFGLFAGAVGDITENFNNVWQNSVDRTRVAVGGGSVSYSPLWQPPILYAGAACSSGFKFPWWFGELSEWSGIRAIAGFNERDVDMRGFARPVTPGKNSWGPLQFTDAERDTGTVYAGAASLVLADAGRVQFKVPCTNRAYMVRVRVQREANYAGVNPQLVIKQPGQADRTTTDVGAAGAWNLLEDTFTPAADPEYFFVELVNNNTAVAGNYATYFDNLEIRGEPQQPGEFEHWMWDRQAFDILPADPLVVHGMEYRRRRVPGEVSALEEQ